MQSYICYEITDVYFDCLLYVEGMFHWCLILYIMANKHAYNCALKAGLANRHESQSMDK